MCLLSSAVGFKVMQCQFSELYDSEGGSEVSMVLSRFGLSPRGDGGTPYNGLYRRLCPKGPDTFFRLEVYKRVGISRDGVQKKAEKTAI